MFLKSVLIGLTSALVLSQNASALSCVRPDLAKTMEAAKASEKQYYILVGSFVSTASKPSYTPSPQTPIEQKASKITQANFFGTALTGGSAKDIPLSGFPVDVETSCMGPWCSALPTSDLTQITFVEVRPGQAPILRITPCSDKVFSLTSYDSQIKNLKDCFDRPCVSEQLK